MKTYKMPNLKHANNRQLRAATPKPHQQAPHASRLCALVAFVIVIFLLLACAVIRSSLAQAETKHKANNSNNNNTPNYAKNQNPSTDAAKAQALYSSTLEIVTINSNNNNFAKNSLQQRATAEQQQQQQQHQQLKRITKVDSENFISGVSMAAGHLPNDAATLVTAGVVRNGFGDKINISNQRNEFNERRQKAATAAVPLRPSTKHSTVTTTTNTSTIVPHNVALSSIFERVERPQSDATRTSTANVRPDKHQQKLLLHRQKRYLVFPEGSSFQLVFDLIIPIVDYTNFAIMGITCAVAYELPSKPPSEILENFRDKLNDGTYGLIRRNDSVSNPNAGIKYVDNAHREQAATATVASINTQADTNYGTVAKPLPLPPATSSYYYNYPSANAHQPLGYAPSTAYYTPAAPAAPASAPYAYQAPSHRPPADYFNAKQNFNFNDQSRRPTFDANDNGGEAGGQPNYLHAATGTAASGTADEQQKFADWQRPQQSKWQHWQQYHDKAPLRQQQSQYAGAYEDNWWQRNKQRVQDSWQSKQRQWQKYESGAAHNWQPLTADAAPSSEHSGRAREILQQPPKHRVYPIFGRRRRRRRRESEQPEPADAFELKLDAIHLREQLQTRQKLYGKIEKLFKVRGYNGTACVLRALCETGQRQQQRQPQTFIAELLRAVFSLPPADRRRSGRQLEREEEEEEEAAEQQVHTHVAPHYRHAHAYTGNCAQLFAMCQHSIWR